MGRSFSVDLILLRRPASSATPPAIRADQLDKMEAQQQRELDQLNGRPNNVKGLP